MPVPTLVTDLSTTAASNSPSGSDNVFPDLDNYLRALSAFLASIRDNSGNGWTTPYLPLTYSAGTANGVVYLNGSKVVTTGSALVFDGTNFSTTGTATATKLIPTGGAATGNGMYLPAANTLAWSNNGAETMRLDSSGNLGLGVTPSAWGASGTLQALQIKNTSLAGSGTNAYWGSNWYGGGFDKYITTGAASLAVQTGGQHLWYTAPSGTAGNNITFTQAMTLDASGNLAVGTTSAADSSARATFSGTSTVLLDASGSLLRFNKSAGTDTGWLSNRSYSWHDGNGLALSTQTADPLCFGTNGAERARITSGGDLLVGKTASGFNTVGIELQPGGTLRGTTADSTAVQVQRKNSDGYIAEFWRASSLVGNISVTTSATAYNTSSDYRLKDNPQPLTGSGAFIDALQPKTWNWKADGSRGVGFIAHEAQAVSPSSVVGEKDAVDEDGKPVMQAMEYGSAEFIANIIAELQSLRARVAALEAQP